MSNLEEELKNIKMELVFERNQMSNLVNHARRELEIIGEDPETIEGLVKVVQAFADMGHSGGSASVAIPMLNDLLQFKNLAPLTNDPEEWMELEEAMAGQSGMYQNVRNPAAFSTDGGRTYYYVDDPNRKMQESIRK